MYELACICPSIYMIPQKSWPISLDTALYHFSLYPPLIMCLYSWEFPISRKVTAFIWPGWMVTSPVILFVIYQSYPVWRTVVYGGAWVGIFLGSVMVVTCLAIKLLPFKCLSLVLYFFTGGTWMGFPSYGWGAGGTISLSCGMTCGAFWGGWLVARPRVTEIV